MPVLLFKDNWHKPVQKLQLVNLFLEFTLLYPVSEFGEEVCHNAVALSFLTFDKMSHHFIFPFVQIRPILSTSGN